MLEMTNFRVTILGEVASPGEISIIGEELNIVQALGLAGDFSDYADRKNVLVIRGTGSEQQFGYVNFQSRKQLFSSEWFQLKQNDVIYVVPVKQRTIQIANETQRILPYLTLGITILNLVIILTTI